MKKQQLQPSPLQDIRNFIQDRSQIRNSPGVQIHKKSPSDTLSEGLILRTGLLFSRKPAPVVYFINVHLPFFHLSQGN